MKKKASPVEKDTGSQMRRGESLTAEPKESEQVLVPERQKTHKCVKCGKMWRTRLESREGECECDGV